MTNEHPFFWKRKISQRRKQDPLFGDVKIRKQAGDTWFSFYHKLVTEAHDSNPKSKQQTPEKSKSKIEKEVEYGEEDEEDEEEEEEYVYEEDVDDFPLLIT